MTLLKYFKYLEEAGILRRLYSELDKMTDLQKPDKLFFDNTNLIYALGQKEPLEGTLRECFSVIRLPPPDIGLNTEG